MLVQPPMLAPLPVLYLPEAHAVHQPLFEQLLVLNSSSGLGQLQFVRYVPALQPLLAHGVCE